MQLQGYDPSCLRELMLEIIGMNSPSGNTGLQVCLCFWSAIYLTFKVLSSNVNFLMTIFYYIFFQILDRNWGAGWHLLSLLLATKPSKRIR